MSTWGRGHLVVAEVDLDPSPDPQDSTGADGGPTGGGPVGGPDDSVGPEGTPEGVAALL